MKSEHRNSHNKLLWFFSLGIGIILIICMVFTVLFKSFERIAYHSLLDLNHEFAVQTDALTEIMNSSMADYAMQLFYSPPIQILRSKNPITDSRSRESLRDLDNILNSSDFLTSIIVHNGYTNTVYSSGVDNAVQGLENYDNHALQTLIVNKNEEPVLTPIYCRSLDPSKEGYYAVMYYTRRDSGSPAPSTLVLTIKASWYEKNLSLFANYATKLVVFNEFGDVLMASNRDLKELCSELYPLATEESGYFKTSNDNICMYHKSNTTGYTYMRLLTLKEMLPQLYAFRNMMFVIIGCLITVFSIILFLLILKTWFPLIKLQRVVNTIGTLLDTPTAVSPINAEEVSVPVNQPVESVVLKVERVQMEHIFYDMLMGKIAPDMSSLFTKETPYYGMFLISAPHRKDIYRVTAEKNTSLIACKTGSAYACIGGFSDEEEYEQLRMLLYQALSVRVFYSPLFTDVHNITEHFANIQELQKLNISFPEKQWQISEEILLEKNEINPFKARDYTDFASKLKSGNAEAGIEKGDYFIEQLVSCRYEVLQRALQTMSELIERLITETGMSESRSTPSIPDHLEQLESIGQLREAMKENIVLICEYFSQEKITKYSLQAADIKKIIEEQFHDPDLSSQRIADLCHMNNAYLGRIFKKSSGCSINEYINQCRLNECMQLLQTCDSSVEEIAKQAGFYNIKYFYVLFKKKTGMTPTAYRLAATS